MPFSANALTRRSVVSCARAGRAASAAQASAQDVTRSRRAICMAAALENKGLPTLPQPTQRWAGGLSGALWLQAAPAAPRSTRTIRGVRRAACRVSVRVALDQADALAGGNELAALARDAHRLLDLGAREQRRHPRRLRDHGFAGRNEVALGAGLQHFVADVGARAFA